mmetsp:Transcript_3545/g.6665  ORF Transcript_3545/g.6665 Transcript_3545/m.6665 type:complete len:207 (+) Transcript_3545:100-720(+)
MSGADGMPSEWRRASINSFTTDLDGQGPSLVPSLQPGDSSGSSSSVPREWRRASMSSMLTREMSEEIKEESERRSSRRSIGSVDLGSFSSSPPVSPNGDFEGVPRDWRRASKFHPGPPGTEVTEPDSPLTSKHIEKREKESKKISKKMGGIEIPDSWLLNRRESTESVGGDGLNSPLSPGNWLREDSKDGESKEESKNNGEGKEDD